MNKEEEENIAKAIAHDLYKSINGKLNKKYRCGYANSDDEPDGEITISQCNDRRNTRIFIRCRGSLVGSKILFFTKWNVCDEQFTVDIQDPKSLGKLEEWIIRESIDGLKRGWSGREK